jgi:hypothetical protein
LSADLQSLIQKALDENEYLLMASLDHSYMFDVVNMKLLIKRMKIIGLPNDVISLIRIWLKQRSFVPIEVMKPVLFDLLL